MTSLETDTTVAPSVLSRTARGAGWTIGWRFVNRAIGFCNTLVLVRLLTPDDFGLVTLAISLFQSLDQLVGFGVEGAIIRADNASRMVLDAGFTINVVRGLFTAGVLAAGAGFIAAFFGNPHLLNIIYVLAATWVCVAFQNIGIVEYRRNMAFDMEFRIQLIPRILSLALTIPSAFLWHSYWALVAGIVAARLMTVALSYAIHPYRPWFGISGLRYIFSFSFWEWLIGLMNMVNHRADTFTVGHLLGPAQVGVYGAAGEIASLPNSEIIAPLCRALFSGFVAERRAGDDSTATLLRVFSALALITFPVGAGLSLVAFPVIKLGFGDVWLGAVPLIEVMGLAALVSLFSSVAEALFSANAWLQSILWMSILGAALRVLLLLLLIPGFGLLGGAIAAVGVSVLQEAIYLALAMRHLKIRPAALLARVVRPTASVGIMVGVLNLAGLGWNSWSGTRADIALKLFSAVILGAGVYVSSLIGLWLLAGRPAGAETDGLNLLRRILRRT
jgi:lipopolysaccharide exporter